MDFGEGINEMRYFNGQIQFKEDPSENSFEKEDTENSLVEIIDFNIKRETYHEVLEMSIKKFPKPLLEFSIWLVLMAVLLVGIALVNFLLFYINTGSHGTYVSVLTNLDVMRFQYCSIAHSALEIGYINIGVDSDSTSTALQNISQKMQQIALLSSSLTQNESYINNFFLTTQVGNGSSLYDAISEFKLSTNNILNNPGVPYDFNISSPIVNLLNLSLNYMSSPFYQLSHNLRSIYGASIN